MILYVNATQARIAAAGSTGRVGVECYQADVPDLLRRLTPKERQEVADILATMGVVGIDHSEPGTERQE